jgi:hypothetical protein
MCQSQEFVRPRFFAGQLLTEDDLQQLGDYVVAKNRLHNRFLFGEGVVCGLEVICHPCGDGQVIVQPGYALDCCGNDLTLACPQTLDINAMVAELRRKLLGFDCGDPCVNQGTTGTSGAASQGETQPKPQDITRHYCLYLRYCETSTDPVAPYSTGEPCGAQVCEPTRVREGVQFELRCCETGKVPETLITRLMQCVGNLEDFGKAARNSVSFYVQGQTIRTALSTPLQDIPPDRLRDYLEGELAPAIRALREESEKLRAGLQPSREAPSAPAATPDSVLAAAQKVVSLTARFYAQSEDNRRGMLEDENFRRTLDEAHQAFADVQRQLAEAQYLSRLSALERVQVEALFSIGNQVAESRQAASTEAQLLAKNVVLNRAVLNASLQELRDLREWLLDQLDKSPHLADCQLREDVRSIVLEATLLGGEVRASEADDYAKSGRLLVHALVRYVLDCVCAALNPVCQPCNDPAILLACLEVKDCKVVRICNLERTFVISPTAIRYWLPLHLLGSLIEQLCCPGAKLEAVLDYAPIRRIGERFSAENVPQRLSLGALSSPSGVLQSVLSTVLSEVFGKDEAQMRSLTSSIIGRLF